MECLNQNKTHKRGEELEKPSKVKMVIRFLIFFAISFLLIEGIEHILHEVFDIHMNGWFSWGGLGVIILFGFKFHMICCVIPSIIAAILCIKKRHKHCDHDHCKNGAQDEKQP